MSEQEIICYDCNFWKNRKCEIDDKNYKYIWCLLFQAKKEKLNFELKDYIKIKEKEIWDRFHVWNF